ncbi:hypothetical protein MKX01_030483 [Papaver californicum]|nr:hypothetical protein MKX01_030483 [Papaver californicum]
MTQILFHISSLWNLLKTRKQYGLLMHPEAKLVKSLVQKRVLGTLKRNMYLDARRFGTLRKIMIDWYPLQCRHLLFKGFKGINLSDWPEIYREEQRKHDQAKRALRFKVTHQRRFLNVQCSKSDSFDGKYGMLFKLREGRLRGSEDGSYSSRLLPQQIEKLSRVISLTDVMILPKVGGQGGETIVGTLEAHASKFVYTASTISMNFHFDNIKNSFFRLGDKRMPPLLHFHLRDPIIVGTEKAKDIYFHLVHCPLGKSSDQDSDKIEKKKRIRVGGNDEDLKNFVDEVCDRWASQFKPPFLFEEQDKEYEFYGVLPSKASAGFAVTLFSFIGLGETPIVVVPLRDIEIVHLALLRPGEIDMTVIFQDFKADNVLEISSIPLKSLSAIKDCLNEGLVKYYVNAEKQDWKTIVGGIADSPFEFMKNGGWDYFKLEDSHTYAYYSDTGTDQNHAIIE